jgi:hypothetical protein
VLEWLEGYACPPDLASPAHEGHLATGKPDSTCAASSLRSLIRSGERERASHSLIFFKKIRHELPFIKIEVQKDTT